MALMMMYLKTGDADVAARFKVIALKSKSVSPPGSCG
jgi:hypothetical protein